MSESTPPATRLRLCSLKARGYLSLREVDLDLGDLNVLIGANASGKSNIIDVLKLAHEAVAQRTFADPVRRRGGLVHLAWKGEEAGEVALTFTFEGEARRFEWTIVFVRYDYDFGIKEDVYQIVPRVGRVHQLHADHGEGWWGLDSEQVPLSLQSGDCALAAAAADSRFPARDLATFVRGWGFFDPNPSILRRASGNDAGLGFHGENLAPRLKYLRDKQTSVYEQILAATRAVIGVPQSLEFRETEGGVYFVQQEPGLEYRVHQVGASSGTLRMLALMTALYGNDRSFSTLIGLEEPENYVHPAAIAAFAQTLAEASTQVQLAVTTHSPLMLDCIGDPEVVRVVSRVGEAGTRVTKGADPTATRRALAESGFGLGEWLEAQGFGG